MEKGEQTQILNLEFIRIKVIVNELVKSSNKNLTSEELVLYIDNLNQIINLSLQITKSLRECKKRAESALKTSRNLSDKAQIASDPDFIQLREKLDILYKKALEERKDQTNS